MMTGNRPIWIGSARMLVLAAAFGYLQAARAVPATADNMWAAGLFSDLRARRVNDLVTVRVVENITASGSADSALDKKSNGSASVTNLFGAENKFPGWLDATSLAGPPPRRSPL